MAKSVPATTVAGAGVKGFGNPGKMLTPLQMLSLHYNPSCDGCARDAEESRMREEFGRQNVDKERLNVIYTF